MRHAAELLGPVAQDRDVAFLLNDRAHLVAETGADGVHIGADDMPYKQARKWVGEDRTVGVSCYDSVDRAMRAAEQGADYVAFGTFFPSKTKESGGRPEIGLLEGWSMASTVPCVAIGGITPENCGPLVRAGADFLAVVNAVWDHPDGPAAAVKAFNVAVEKALEAPIAIPHPS